MSANKLFTFVLECKKGTYISQIFGLSVADVVEKWATSRSDQDLNIWGIPRTDLADLANENLTPIEGCSNVWCVTGLANEKLILLNIIATSS